MHTCEFCGNECDCDMEDSVMSFQPDNCDCPCIASGVCELCGDDCDCFDDDDYPLSDSTCIGCLHDAEYCVCDE